MKHLFKVGLAFWLGGVAWAGAQAPKRVISLMPSNTEIVYALGAQDALVGVTRYCDYPPEAKSKDQVGDFLHPNFEKIISLKPDLVLAGDWKTSRIVPRLKKAGIPVAEIRLPATVQEMFGTITEIARVLGRDKEGQALVSELQTRVDRLAELGRRRKRHPRVYIEVDPPNWTVSSKSPIHDAVQLCGGVNIFGHLPVSGAQISWESVVHENPDVLILFSTTREEIAKRPGWTAISAVKNGRMADKFTRLYLNRPSPRLIQGMELLSQTFTEMGFE